MRQKLSKTLQKNRPYMLNHNNNAKGLQRLEPPTLSNPEK